jgi:DNA (cytosine-5)-methyltransferase 1
MAVGGDLAWYSEIEPAACKVLEQLHPDVPNIGDITAVDWSQVEPVDVITGGYPCQPFSHAGKRKGKQDERHLWPYVRDAISALRPSLAVLENVRGHLSLGLADVIGDLAGLGYDARWGVVRASDAGAPHGRARVFIVAEDSRRLVGPQATARGDHQDGQTQWSSSLDARSSGNPAYPHGTRSQGSNTGVDVAAGRGDTGGFTTAGNHCPTTDTASAERRGAQSKHLGTANGSTAEPRELAGAAWDSDSHDDAPQQARDWQGPQSQRNSSDGRQGNTDWSQYQPAVQRWQNTIGRPAPAPTVQRGERNRLNPVFVEWMMGLPEGHVTGHGLTAAQELKMLGNGVVPQQAALALRLLGVR